VRVFGVWVELACADLFCCGFAETDPGSFNNTVAEKQVIRLDTLLLVRFH
jgi:hypothetical protein